MKTIEKSVMLVLMVCVCCSFALAQGGGITVLGQQAGPLGEIKTKVRSVTDRFDEPYPGKKWIQPIWDKASAAWNAAFGGSQAVKEDGFVYVRSVEVLSALPKDTSCALFDVVKDALRQSPADWENKDYRRAKAVYTQQYFRSNFASDGKRVGKKVFCKKAPVQHLGQKYVKGNRKELTSVLSKYDVNAKDSASGEQTDIFLEKVLRELKSAGKQTSIVGLKYLQGYDTTPDGDHRILVYKAEKCKVKELVSYDDETIDAVALHFVELDPLVKSEFLTDEEVKEACHKMFIIDKRCEGKRMTFEYSYLKKHAKAYKCKHGVNMQPKRFLTSSKVTFKEYGNID